MKKKGAAVVLFRRDLRLTDHLALLEACQYEFVVPVFIWAPETERPWVPGTGSRWWLHGSLESLQSGLQGRGSELLFIRSKDFYAGLAAVVDGLKPSAVFISRQYEPESRKIDEQIEQQIPEGVVFKSYPGSLLTEPGDVLKKDKTCYQVFTAFWNEFIKRDCDFKPKAIPASIPGLPPSVKSLKTSNLDALQLRSTEQAVAYDEAGTPGESAALARLDEFLQTGIESYDEMRNIPGVRGTSQMSAPLHFGELSPRTIWHRVTQVYGLPAKVRDSNIQQYLKELVWREFSHQILWYHPTTDRKPLRVMFKKFPWSKNKKMLERWQQGQTGYPIVDAGMRELLHTGWMHNRVRMIVASFLVKDLLIPWQDGAAWFWENLIDADLANNSMGWQWTAGCGPDAAPFFRVFNPVLQGQKFDPQGTYIRKYVPELAALPDKLLFAPWEAPIEALESAGVDLGRSYPLPIVDHGEAKLMALKSYEKMKREVVRT